MAVSIEHWWDVKNRSRDSRLKTLDGLEAGVGWRGGGGALDRQQSGGVFGGKGVLDRQKSGGFLDGVVLYCLLVSPRRWCGESLLARQL